MKNTRERSDTTGNSAECEPFVYIKIGKEKHIRELYDEGKIYMNTLPHFWSVEDGGVRGDPYDGVTTLHRGTEATLSMAGIEKPMKIVSWEFGVKPNRPECVNVFCMYSLRKSTFPFDERVRKFGDTSLIVTDMKEFVDRIKKSLKDKGIRTKASSVEYVSDKHEGPVGPFRKREMFRWQSEWRFVTYDGPEEPRDFKIGSLRDIAVTVPTGELNSVFGAMRGE